MSGKFQIEVFNESSIKYLPKEKLIFCTNKTLEGEGIKEGEINIVLMNNEDIQQLNRKYLNHDYPTDVISFKYDDKPLSGEIYIGAEVAKEQSSEFKVSLTNELMRLAVHGTLHLIGYEDDEQSKKEQMHKLENKYIKIK